VKTVIKMISSGLYVGYVPFAPGTFGSLLGVLIYLLLIDYPIVFKIVTFFLFTLGFLICTKAEEVYGQKDCQKIVIDETASMCLVLIFTKPGWLNIAIAFLLFRLFDILKLPPAKRIENLPGSIGIMLDDAIAAIYSIAILSICYLLNLLK